MVQTIKEYFKNKREHTKLVDALTLLLLNRMNDNEALKEENLKKEASLYESVQTMNEAFCPEELKAFMESINQFVKKPELNQEFYKQIVKFSQKTPGEEK